MMSFTTCAITEVLVAIGDSYWRCVSCQVQFSRQVSIDEHVMLRHGGNHPHIATTATNAHSQASHLPLASPYRVYGSKCHVHSHITDPSPAEHNSSVIACSVPAVVKINLDSSSENKIPHHNTHHHELQDSQFPVPDTNTRDDTESQSLQFSLVRSDDHSCPSIADSVKDTHSMHLKNSNENVTSIGPGISPSIDDASGNVCKLKETSVTDCSGDEEGEEADKGTKSLLNSMLSLLEKSMEMDDISGVIQNWDALNPELFEQQLLNNNSDLSLHSLNSGCGPLDPAENPLNSTEELLNTAVVESLNSGVDFLSSSNQLLNSSPTEDNVKSRKTSTSSDVAEPSITEAENNNAGMENTTESQELGSSNGSDNQNSPGGAVKGSSDANEDGKEEEDEDDDDNDRNLETIENIAEFLKKYLEFSASQFSLVNNSRLSVGPEVDKRTHVNSEPNDLFWRASVSGDGDVNSGERLNSNNRKQYQSVVAFTESSTCTSTMDFRDAMNSYNSNQVPESDVRICSPEATLFAKLSLLQGRRKNRPEHVPPLFIAASPSPLTCLGTKRFVRKFPQSQLPRDEQYSVEKTNRTDIIKCQKRKVSASCDTSHNISEKIPRRTSPVTVPHLSKSLTGKTSKSSVKVKQEDSLLPSDNNKLGKSGQSRKQVCLKKGETLSVKLKIGDKNENSMVLSKQGKECEEVHAAEQTALIQKEELVSSSIERAVDEEALGMEQVLVVGDSKGGKHQSKTVSGTLSASQIRKLKKDVLAIMKSQHSSKTKTSPLSKETANVGREILLKVRNQNKQCKKNGSSSEDLKWKMCQLCDRRFSTQGALQRHIKVNATVTDACKCKVCSKKFHSLAQLNIHIYKYHETKSKPSCFRCNTYFTNIRALTQHVQKHHKTQVKEVAGARMAVSPSKGKAWRCGTCGLICLNQPHIIAAHKCKVNSSPQNKCKQCDKKFPSRSSLNVHMAAHLGCMYECDLCGQFFKNKTSRHYHKLSHESVKGEFLCQVCGQQFAFQHKLTAHVKIHSKEKKPRPIYVCGVCDRNYKSKRCLQRHIDVVHKGIKDYDYKCENCNQQFFSSWQLRDHIAWHHFGEKPYHCQYCGQGFVCKPTLVRHQRKEHTGIKPHKCRFCEEAFVDKKNLDTHEVKVHTGVFPFVCMTCGKGFVHRNALHAHMVSHSNKRPYQCHICGNCFTKTSHLKRHTKSCIKKNVPATLENQTLTLDLENLPDIPSRPPSSFTPYMLPQSDDDILQLSGSFLAQTL